jgi:hypothetical protein
MDRRAGTALAALVCLAVAAPGAAEEFKFDRSEFEKPAFQIGGYVEGKTEYFRLDTDAALYRLNALGNDLGDDNARTTGTGEIRARYEKGLFTAVATIHGSAEADGDQGGADSLRLYEGGVAVRPVTGLSLDLGKKVLKWGKGYGWNPIGFVERTKDPTDPDLSREGFWMLNADYVRSFKGPLETIAVTPVILPVTEDMNEDFGQREHVNLGGKIYFLYEKTDIDVAVLASGTKTFRVGADFSRNLLSNLEIHGEIAYVADSERKALDQDRRTTTVFDDVVSGLLGIRYLTERDTTYIVEYYRNGTGFTSSETRDFFKLAHDAVGAPGSGGNSTLLQRALALNQAGYGRMTPARDYLYARISQKEPFDILYFTPSIIGIANLGDRSLSLTPELLYTGITNLEFRLRGQVNLGGSLTEFGEKQAEGKVELRIRYFF